MSHNQDVWELLVDQLLHKSEGRWYPQTDHGNTHSEMWEVCKCAYAQFEFLRAQSRISLVQHWAGIMFDMD